MSRYGDLREQARGRRGNLKKVAVLVPGDVILSFPDRFPPTLYAGEVRHTVAQGDDADTFEVHQEHGSFKACGADQVEVADPTGEDAA